MNIVLNEYEWAENMINSRSLGTKPSETLKLIARYYFDTVQGSTKKDVRKRLEAFILQCEPDISLPKWENTIDKALARAAKSNAVNIDCIKVTKPEIEQIDSLEGKQIRRLAFTLLCLSKYWNIAGRSADNWVNSKDSEIMRMANINTSVKRQSLMYHILNKADMIQFSKKVDNTNVRVCFATPGETAMTITDFRNLGYQYLKYHGEPYFECCNCGITTKYTNSKNKNSFRKQKYCKSCAVEIDMKQSINSVMRLRDKDKAG